ncbi:RNA-directed DNA polymerase, eukaryota, reverse transcriptase zinc-binding domain protein [Tanacetum coccineum]
MSMGSFRSKEDEVCKVSTSFFVSNFLDKCTAKELWNACKQYGNVVDAFIPNRRSKAVPANKETNNTFENKGVVRNSTGNVHKETGVFGHANSYVHVVKNGSHLVESEVSKVPTMVLDDSCLNKQDFSLNLFGKVKEFASLSNLKRVLANEGFDNVGIKYMGGHWVMLEFHSDVSKKMFEDNTGAGSWFNQLVQASKEFVIDERVTWVEIEGIPIKMCSENTFIRIASKWGFLLNGGKKEDDELHKKRLCIKGSDKNKDDEYSKNIHMDEKEDVAESFCSGHFKKSGAPRTGGSIVQLIDDLVKVGLSQKAKKDWVKELCIKNKVNFLSLQETKMESIELFSIKKCWGNFAFDYVHSASVGNSGGEVIIMGDFNEVRNKDERFGSCFNKQGAEAFNMFIANTSLEEVSLGEGTEDVVNRRSFVCKSLQDMENIKALDAAQKAKIKWAICMENDNSNMYHCILKKKRSQSSIRGVLVDGNWIKSPCSVKSEFFSHFKIWFEQPQETHIHININFPNTITFGQKEDLESMVSKEEIKRAVWECGTDKSSGPDGFTFGFYRRFWKVIEKDVVEAVTFFFCNGYFPKGGCVYKIIAKVLANRLVPVLGNIVSEVQSAFIANRQILDGPFILNEIVQWCKSRRKQSMIFKVDFKKAYDSVRWDFVDDILKNFGFGENLRGWINGCLRSSRGSVIVNGSPTNEFQFYKGFK